MTPERFIELIKVAYGDPTWSGKPTDSVTLPASELRWFIDVVDNANRVMFSGQINHERRLCRELGMAFPPANTMRG